MAKKQTDDNEILEKVQDAGPKTMDFYESSIEAALIDFAERECFESPREMSQQVWNAALMYCRKQCINRHDLLDDSIYTCSIPEIGKTNNNAYNIYILNQLADLYIALCMKYNKECSVIGFSYLTGVDDATISGWGTNDKVTSRGIEVYKKLHKSREESLSDKLVDSKQVVGILGILNKHYQWATPYGRQDTVKVSLSVDDIRQQIGLGGAGPTQITGEVAGTVEN